MNNQQLFSALGLAMRAGKLVTGDEGVLDAIRSKKARLVIIAEDASENTRKKFLDKCKHYQVPIHVCCSRVELGACIGKPARVSLAVMDPGFRQMIDRCIANHSEVENIE